MKVECQNYFMIRTPSLPVEYLFEYKQQEKDIYEFIKSNYALDEYFRKALLFSSRSLYDSYINKPENPKKYNNLKESLLKYFVRSIIRPTPYGYFANISVGKFGEYTYLKKGTKKLDLRMDCGWLNALVHNLEGEKEILSRLKLKKNKLCYRRGDRYVNPYYTNHGLCDYGEKLIKENSIKYSNLIKLVGKITEEFIEYGKIFEMLQEEYEGISQELIDDILYKLVQHEFLYTNLRIPTYCVDGLDYIIEQLEIIEYKEEVYLELIEIKELISLYKDDDREEIILQLYNKAEKICKRKECFILNVGERFQNNLLDIEIKNKIEKLAKLLCKIPVKHYSIEKFQEKFVDTYGYGIEVPIVDIIDEKDAEFMSSINGFGKIKNTEDEKRIQTILDRKIFEAIKNKEEEVFFTEEDFCDITDKNEIINSFDLNIIVTRKDEEVMLWVGPNYGSDYAGAMIQRFSECLSSDEQDEYEKILLKQDQLLKDEYLFVEGREASIHGKQNNIVNNRNRQRFYMTCGNCSVNNQDKEITIDDIYVGIDHSHIYVKSKKLDKKLYFFRNDMLNPYLNNPILQLVFMISESYSLYPLHRIMMLNANYKYQYMPRINFEGIIVSPQRWNFSEYDLPLTSYEEFAKKFSYYIKRHEIQQDVYMVNADNRIIVNVDKEDSIRLLYKEFRKKKNLVLSEIETNLLRDTVVSDIKNKSYINECVFSILPENVVEHAKEQNKINKICQRNNILLGEEGWIYFKIYGYKKNIKDILCVELQSLLSTINHKLHFFIRYIDQDGEHLRIRIQFFTQIDAYKKMPQIIEWMRGLLDRRIISNVVFDNYVKEINRYGGDCLISYCEEIFCTDSILVEKMLEKYDMEEENNLDKLYLFGIVGILINLTHNMEEALRILDNCIIEHKYKDTYRKKQKIFISYVKDIVNEISDINIDLLFEWQNEKQALDIYKHMLYKEIELKRNTNSKESIILSIIHMYCNRLLGDRDYERKYIEIARDAIYHIIQQEKRKTSNERK